MIKIKIKYIIDPVIFVPLLYCLQFIVYLLFFDRFKHDVYLLENIETFLRAESIIKWILLFFSFYIGILLGRSYKIKFRLNDNAFYKATSKGVFLTFIIILLSEIFTILKLKSSSLFSGGNLKSFAVLSNVTIQNEEVWYRTFLNFGLFVVTFYYYYFHFFKIINKKKYLRILFYFLTGILFINALFFSQRQIFIIFILIIIFTNIRINNSLKNDISISRIIFFIFIIFVSIIFFELFRYGIFNSSRKGIELFSLENINDIIKYLLVAYISKDVNNALIALSSQPTYNLFSTGSRLIYKIVLIFIKENPYNPIIDPGPHGTLNFLSLIWIDYGYIAFILLPILGLMIGFSYNLYLKDKNFISSFFYSLVFSGVVSTIRINFFFLNIFIYNFILIILSALLYYILYKKSNNRI